MSFNPSRLILARKRRGLSKVTLAQSAGLSSRTLQDYENGQREPTAEAITRLAKALGFPEAFFSLQDADSLTPEGVSFRALSKMTAAQREGALGAGALILQLHDWIAGRFRLPAPDFPDLGLEPPEQAAAALRAAWGLGERPIRNMVHLLEAKGVRVFSLAEEYVEVDAFSFWRNNLPFVILNTQKSGERGRFDAAHELGHLVLHRHGSPEGRQAEIEANAFASAFLMPQGDVLAIASHAASVGDLIKFKHRWGVSVAAMAYRLHKLEILTEWNYRMICIEIGQRGYRKVEPEPIEREASSVLNQIFSSLLKTDIRKADIAKELGIPVQELEKMVFGLVLSALPGGNSTPPVRGTSTYRPRFELL